ncbi:MAG: signal peptidase II [Clostridia bacterium]|nr:signal peptidase II [Clostridia bacterium]
MKLLKRLMVYIWAAILVLVDQIVKLGVINELKGNSITIIKGILKFTYCENKGVAFSFGNGHVPVFIIVNLLIIGGLTFYYEKHKNEFKGMLNKIFFTMVIAGGISNLLDRIFRGYVVDFIDTSDLFNFAIFNVADIFIVVGIVGLAICMIFPWVGNIGRKEK